VIIDPHKKKTRQKKNYEVQFLANLKLKDKIKKNIYKKNTKNNSSQPKLAYRTKVLARKTVIIPYKVNQKKNDV